MIQRIQSLYLLFVVVFTVSSFYIPTATFEESNGALHQLFAAGMVQSTISGVVTNHIDYLYLSFSIIIVVIAFAAIFLYKNRPLQIKMCKILIIFLATLFLYLIVSILIFKSGGIYTLTKFDKGIILPLVSVFATLMAIRGIRKDDELVKSADRLR